MHSEGMSRLRPLYLKSKSGSEVGHGQMAGKRPKSAKTGCDTPRATRRLDGRIGHERSCFPGSPSQSARLHTAV